jgi:hypothetical protein
LLGNSNDSIIRFSHNLNLPKNDKSHILIQNVAFLGQVLQKKIPECQKFLCDGNKMLLPSTVALSKLFMDKLITDTDTASNDKNVFADFLVNILVCSLSH